MEIDQSLVSSIPNIEPPPTIQAGKSDIASRKNACASKKMSETLN
jgi:hypothetical protein